MVSPNETLRQKMKSFFLGVGTFSYSLIIASELEEKEFRFMWNEEKEHFIKKESGSFKGL